MSRSRYVVLALNIVILVSSLQLVFAAEPDKTSDASREAFVRDFDRSILNTTPEDAMMLRILIESMGAQRGVEVGSSGDGFVARFDGPARAIRCAQAIIEAAEPHGLGVRAGVHTGEIEIIGDDIAGIAVHIGARIGGIAGGGEVLVSGAVRDIVAGSGLSFDDRGEHQLKGVPGAWRVFSLNG